MVKRVKARLKRVKVERVKGKKGLKVERVKG